mmetsp:Transcript_39906/g.93211  ORF Transcript_39906/g.93211 Transcript_39906/m.93211 type:complete len:228 (-) Transcript_39906:445-1128(-)
MRIGEVRARLFRRRAHHYALAADAAPRAQRLCGLRASTACVEVGAKDLRALGHLPCNDARSALRERLVERHLELVPLLDHRMELAVGQLEPLGEHRVLRIAILLEHRRVLAGAIELLSLPARLLPQGVHLLERVDFLRVECVQVRMQRGQLQLQRAVVLAEVSSSLLELRRLQLGGARLDGGTLCLPLHLLVPLRQQAELHLEVLFAVVQLDTRRRFLVLASIELLG